MAVGRLIHMRCRQDIRISQRSWGFGFLPHGHSVQPYSIAWFNVHAISIACAPTDSHDHLAIDKTTPFLE